MKHIDQHDRIRSLEVKSGIYGKWMYDQGGFRKQQEKRTDENK